MAPNSIKIDEVEYIRKDSIESISPVLSSSPFVLIRTYSAGVHYGYLVKRESTLAGIEVTLQNARRIWYWSGANSLSQIATEGVKKPNDCKFSVEVPFIQLVAIEIINITKLAQINLNEVKVWKQ